jgi:hypothetical protein
MGVIELLKVLEPEAAEAIRIFKTAARPFVNEQIDKLDPIQTSLRDHIIQSTLRQADGLQFSWRKMRPETQPARWMPATRFVSKINFSVD